MSATAKNPERPTAPEGPTGLLSTWLESMSSSGVPEPVQARAKHLLLDGIGCLLVGSRLEWSALGVDAVTAFDEGGRSLLAGWGGKRTSAYSAALLNGSFIQAFELDDYYPAAPLHSNSIIIPAMLPIVERHPELDGADFLLALTVGYEVGTRVGLALHGAEMLSRGWHSGVVFGCAAAAASAGKLLKLSAARFEDALGMACTQACGLMSAQFESMVKRMQHGFAARNGLYAAVLAERGYVGIKRVFEREYGGFLSVFGEGHHPDASQISIDLGKRWITTEIAVKPYAAMGGLHAAIDACLAIRREGDLRPDQIRSISVEVGEAAFKHGGFEIQQPIEPITAQMSLRYSVAVALLDGAALLQQFSHERINREDVWGLIAKTSVRQEDSFERKPHTGFTTRVTVTFRDGSQRVQTVETPSGGVDRPLSNEDIEAKFNMLAATVVDERRAADIRDLVLNIETQPSLAGLLTLLETPTRDALA